VATSELYRASVEARAWSFALSGPIYPIHKPMPRFYAQVMDPVRGGARLLLQQVVAPNLRHSYHDLRDAVHDADLLVSHSMCAVAPLVAASSDCLGFGHVSPMFLQSEYDPPSLPCCPRWHVFQFLESSLCAVGTMAA
jgi:hypothetical protein